MRVFILLLILALPTICFARGYDNPGETNVRGYFKKDGTYVQSHKRTKRDQYNDNNWSTRGNINPYTGKEGTKRRRGDAPLNHGNSGRRSRK